MIVIALLVVLIAILLLGAFQKNEPLIDVPSLQRTINNLKREVSNRESKILQLEKENRCLMESNNSFKNATSSLTYELSQKSRELLRKDNECSGKDSVIRGLNFQCNDLKDSLKEAKDDADKIEWMLSELNEKYEASEAEVEGLIRKIDSFDSIIEAKNPFDYVAHLRVHALEHINEYVGKSVDELAELFKYQYKFEYLLSIYPELRKFKDDDAYIKYKEEEEKRCNIKNWLPEEKYSRLSETEREQLAVDRYIEQEGYQWSDWEKGRNYEIYCAYILYNEGYDIAQEGLNKKLEDKGRDIIAIHRKSGEVLIVQCKNWKGEVRENVVFQLFGSYAQWLAENGRRLGDDAVMPWLYVTGAVSEEAKRCAEILKVQIRILPMGKFPAIKCNVNHNTGQKIYHLPFDRHYDLVKINVKGKGYKFKIAEAITEGFRRAYNH